MNEKELLQTLDPLISAMGSMQKQLNLLERKPGPKGEDADPEKVAEILASKYLDSIKGEPGKDAQEVDLEALAVRLGLDEKFIEACKGAPGKDADIELIAALVVEKYSDELRGEDGETPNISNESVRDTLLESDIFLEQVKGEPGPAPDMLKLCEVFHDEYHDQLKGDPGQDGKSPTVEEVQDALVENKRFLALVKGEPGKDADHHAIAEIIIKEYADLLKGEDGKDAEPVEICLEDVKETLLASDEFLRLVKGAKGDDGKDADSAEVAQKLFQFYRNELKGEKGDKGDPGKDVDEQKVVESLKSDPSFLCEIRGAKGEKGDDATALDITVPQWREGVYLKDTVVQHDFGRYYRAIKNTASEPGKTPEWERLGSGGFAWKGIKTDQEVYEDGDFYIDNGTTFLFLKGKGRMFAKRGRDGKDGVQGVQGEKGDKGDRGQRGAKGEKGDDAPHIVTMQFDTNQLALVLSDGEILEGECKGMEDYVASIAEQAAISAVKAVEEKASKNGTPLKLYRDLFQSGTSYRAGDLVSYNAGLYLCRKSGRFTEINDEWTKISGGSSSTLSQASLDKTVIDSMYSKNVTTWNGYYEVGDTVTKGTMVNDDGWLMVANADTSDKAAPQAIGVLESYGTTLPDDDTGWTSKVNESLRFLWVGTQYHLDYPYIISHIAFYIAEVSTDIVYDIFVIDMTGNRNKYIPVSTNYPAQTTGWHTIPTGQIVVPADSTISIILQKTSTANSTTFAGDWNYLRSNSTPTIGQICQSNNDVSHVLVNQSDDLGTDRQAELDTVVPGSLISAGSVVWEVQDVEFTAGTASDGYYTFTVMPHIRLENGTLYTFTFEVYGTYSLPIWSVPDFYLADPMVQGLIKKDGADVIYDENAYSVDILYQKVIKSDDWDIMSANDTVASNSAVAQQLPLAAGGQAVATLSAPAQTLASNIPVAGASPGDNLVNEFIDMPDDGKLSVLDLVCWNSKRNFHPVMSAYQADHVTPAVQSSAQIIALGAHNFSQGVTYTWSVAAIMASGSPSFFLTSEPVKVDTKVIIKMEFDRRNPDFDVMRFTTNFVGLTDDYHECHSVISVNKADAAAFLQFIEVQYNPGTEWRAFVS